MRGYSAIGVTSVIKESNFGGVMRAAHCYGSSLIVVGGKYRRQASDTTCAHRSIPLLQVNDVMDVVPFDCVPVAVDLVDGADKLSDFHHPERAFYIFGAENQTLGHKVLSRCTHKVFIPTKFCMNLASTVNVVLYDRMVKQDKGAA